MTRMHGLQQAEAAVLMHRLALGALWPPVGEAPAHVAALVLMHRLVLGAL